MPPVQHVSKILLKRFGSALNINFNALILKVVYAVSAALHWFTMTDWFWPVPILHLPLILTIT